MIRTVCLFLGSSGAAPPAYHQLAEDCGRAVAEAGLGLVYGGASCGLMGKAADAALAAGGEVFGVIPEQLVERELAHRSLTELVVVRTMHERKAEMASRSDAFAVLPGGYGTLDEAFEVLTWLQLGLHDKPVFFVDLDDETYWQPIFDWLDLASSRGLLRPEHRPLAGRVRGAAELLRQLRGERPRPRVPPKWI